MTEKWLFPYYLDLFAGGQLLSWIMSDYARDQHVLPAAKF